MPDSRKITVKLQKYMLESASALRSEVRRQLRFHGAPIEDVNRFECECFCAEADAVLMTARKYAELEL